MQQKELYPDETPEPREESLLKHVNAVALMPIKGGGKITVLERKLYNVLLHRAHSAGYRDEYSARLHEIVKDNGFDSKNTQHLKQALRNLIKTIVEWQSPTSGEIEVWEACGLLSGVAIRKDKASNAVVVEWRYDSKIRAQLLSPDRYARLNLDSITQMRTHAAMALYEICARYVDNPGRKTARQHWRWWRPVLCGHAYEADEGEWRYFKRDVLQPAIAEINAVTELEVELLPPFKESDNKTVSDIQFSVRLKSTAKSAKPSPKKSLEQIEPQDLPLIGRAVNFGVLQEEAEGFYREYGPNSLNKALQELEKRLALPSEVLGAVEKPGAYLRSILQKKAVALSKPSTNTSTEATKQASPSVGGNELERTKTALIEEWLRRKKDEVRSLFEELPENEKAEILSKFRATLKHQAVVKRFDESGWNHRMVRDTFATFLGETWYGPDWNKPKADEILAVALEK